uniref:Uncharacterized protein n=1 Tax=Lepeophtheirus salmonis TaxID=72036 RepID=A0A0K2V896_LEPSM
MQQKEPYILLQQSIMQPTFVFDFSKIYVGPSLYRKYYQLLTFYHHDLQPNQNLKILRALLYYFFYNKDQDSSCSSNKERFFSEQPNVRIQEHHNNGQALQLQKLNLVLFE